MKRWLKICLMGIGMILIVALGALFWLNAGSPSDPADRRWPAAPQDAFAALGFQEQKVIIIPSKKLVLVRFGATSDRKTWNSNEFIANVLAALPD